MLSVGVRFSRGDERGRGERIGRNEESVGSRRGQIKE